MIDNGYIFARDNKRVFINTSLGCAGECSYCYLPKIGYKNAIKNIDVKSAEWIIEFLEKSDLLLDENTLITLGCFSECWDLHNYKETIKLIKYFLQRGNQIQLATKRQLKEDELLEIIPLIKYCGQLIIFVSVATISKQNALEKNTTSVSCRFDNFDLLNELNIPCVLYIKPVLKDITIDDLDLFKEYIEKKDIKNIVVGSVFTNEKSDETVHFSDKNELFYNESDDEKIIIEELSKYAKNVCRRSTEVVNSYRVNR